jgi:CRP/FNR family transcriptional regulator, cyclic AMP receptor protein
VVKLLTALKRSGKMGIIDILQSTDLFAGLGKQHLDKLSVLCRGMTYKQGVMIFKEGDKATELYVLTDGKVVLEMDVRPIPDRPGIPTALEIINKGGAFGWSTLVEPYVYTLSARCVNNCAVLAIKSDMLRKAMADDPCLGFELMTHVAKLISLRLVDTRLRLTSGLGLALLGKELRALE